jgi:tetracycline repressor-like protein
MSSYRYAGFSRALTRFRTPRERLLGVFDAQSAQFTDPAFNGCAFVMASAEAPPGGAVEQAAEVYREWVRTLFTTLAKQAGVADPENLARQLHLLYDGAGLSARMDRDPSAAAAARAAAAALFDAAPRAEPA